MLTRIVTALVLAPFVVWLVLAGPAWAVAAVLVVAATLCLAELYAMAIPGRRLEALTGLALNAALLAFAWSRETTALAIAFVAALALPGLVVLARPEPLDGAGHRLLALWGGLVYITGTFVFVLELGKVPGHLMLAFFVVWLGDTGAYFTGRAFGRHKLYELISPKKTVEGAIGGLAASLGGAFLARALFLPDLPVPTTVALGLGGGVLAIAGDLVESAFKRAYGVKDSGRLLPGHGGLLDRLDAFLFTCPFLAVVLDAVPLV